MDKNKIEKGVRLILEGIGEDTERAGLKDTPQRFAKMCEEIFGGIGQESSLEIGFIEDILESDIILVKDISFYSICEHHLLPFFGKVNILYSPQNNRVAGFSDITRIVDMYAQRPQIQERLGRQIADEIMRSLQPAGVWVRIEATQLCVSMRGRHKKDLLTVTEVLRGKLPGEWSKRI
jgi:GTP cyclohydrolase I